MRAPQASACIEQPNAPIDTSYLRGDFRKYHSKRGSQILAEYWRTAYCFGKNCVLLHTLPKCC